MKKSKLATAVLSAFLVLGFTACDALFGDKNNGSSGGGSGNTNVDDEKEGPLTTAETWAGKDSSGNPITYYINETYTIKDGGSLTIEEGAIVKFGEDGGIYVNNQSITADGVIFTSWRDERGKKINAAGTTEAAPGDWGRIYIYGGTAKFTNCEFAYGGKNSSTVEITKGSSGILGKARIDKCFFHYNYGSKSIPDRNSGVKAALKYASSCVYNEDNNCVTNSLFENNVWPVSMPATFYISGTNSFGGNEYEFVYINTASINTNTTWDYLTIPYIFSDNTRLDINANATLTINGGNKEGVPKYTLVTTVCFVNGGLCIKENGTLKVNDYVTFTNNPNNPDIKFTGIECYTYRKWENVGSSQNRLVKLITNGNITVENFQETDKYAPDYINAEHYRCPIQQTNNYNAFYYKYDQQ